jgi:hypothetical protein
MADKVEDMIEELDGALSEATALPDAPTADPRPISPVGYLTLRMPRTTPYSEGFEFPEGNLDFGPSPKHAATHAQTNIKFYADGQGDGYAVVPEDHPLLDALMKRYPQVEVVESNPEPEAWVCEVCEKEYKTKKGLLNHKRGHN